ncbi:hypothetical protein ACFFJY_14355 [Fictibacillus aquaticus]|uniref:Uncharacterized protein n=1 Tax=Fictibacillus aquaticus TaxID=2021314 RepID=A0A235FDG8_9BACL|nr:hypothetical protein [Fictibacillus aquaticus]OYD59398.1 hypothetical protein CGZ90_05780 [Fictibacillus aquaticus]
MKKILFTSLLAVSFLSLSGYQLYEKRAKASEDMKGFIEPEPSGWVDYSKSLNEYMYYRTQAVVKNDIHILWDQYPALKDNIDLRQGVNGEKMEVDSLNEGLDLIDANYDIESYERIKVKTINENEVIALVHGSIIYTINDFGSSGGEYLIKVFLEKKDNQWIVVKTDEYTISEYKDWVKNKGK